MRRYLKNKKKELIMELRITNDKDNENYTKHFKNYSECKEWIYNHLDLSKKWSIEDISGSIYILGGGK